MGVDRRILEKSKLSARRLFVLFFLLLGSAAALAEPVATTEKWILSTLEELQPSCRQQGEMTRKLENMGRSTEAFNSRLAEKNLCECIPRRAHILLDSLKGNEKQGVITQSQFVSRYLPFMADKCTAEQFAASFGEGCSSLFAGRKPDSAKYCSCVSEYIRALPESESTRLGHDFADYGPIAAEAKKKGLPAPEKSAALQRFFNAETACSAP